MTRRKRGILALLTMFVGVAFAGCAGAPIAKLPDGTAEFLLDAGLGEVFRKVVRHEAITLGEKVTIYGSKKPPGAELRCHEAVHRTQAKAIGDALVSIGAIDDRDDRRMYAWIAVYAQEYAQHLYDNRFERAARAQCAGATTAGAPHLDADRRRNGGNGVFGPAARWRLLHLDRRSRRLAGVCVRPGGDAALRSRRLPQQRGRRLCL
jgi:hypothetical protein